MELKPEQFIGEEVEAIFAIAPTLEKKPGCPTEFKWRGSHFRIIEVLAEWHDYRRRGRMSRNMRPTHAESAQRYGSWGVGLDYYRVKTDSDQIFDLYYDRAPADVDRRKGAWFLYQELTPAGDNNR